jgi:O-antigen chain-terminating methyltransferase
VSEGTSAAVDVARLMEEIKERVRQRRAAGLYSEDEVRRITQMELEVAESIPGFHEEVEHLLGAANDVWDVLREPSISSHRGSAMGATLVGAKRSLWKAMAPYTKLVLQRQGEFNAAILHLLNAFVLPVRDKIQDGLTRLGRKQEELALEVHERLTTEHGERARGQQELARRLDTLVADLAQVRALAEHARAAGLSSGTSGASAASGLPPVPTVPAGAGNLPLTAYVRFEDRHRGSQAEIRERQRAYLDLFVRAGGPVLDAGCGRGEFLELCREVGVEALGIDVDAGMVARCREANLRVEQADVLAHLQGLPDGSLGGLFCAQVIEHVPAEAFIALVRLAWAKLRPGGVLLCETPNPACLTVFSGAFYLDLTHLRPIHPEAARFVLEAAGFQDVELRFVNPHPPEAGLQRMEPLWYMRRYEEAFLEGLNDNFARLNALLWGAQDYAVIGWRR